MVNAVWGQPGHGFRDEFLDALAESYGAGVRTADFAAAPDEARVAINDWVAESTEDRIKDLIPPDVINPLTRMVLTNAVYFKAAWAQPFMEAATREHPFELLDGGSVDVPMMQTEADIGYAAGDGYVAVDLPYEGYELSMTLLVPDRGRFAEFEESLDAALVDRIVADLVIRPVELDLPRFEFESRFRMAETLRSMGMVDAFDSRASDFSGMEPFVRSGRRRVPVRPGRGSPGLRVGRRGGHRGRGGHRRGDGHGVGGADARQRSRGPAVHLPDPRPVHGNAAVGGPGDGAVSADLGVSRVSNREPNLVTRACLVCAALLPWSAIFSGTYALYFVVVLALLGLADWMEWLFVVVLTLAAPLAVLLLLLMPAGAMYAAVRRPPRDWLGRITRGGCLMSMVFSVVYGGLMLEVGVTPMFAEGTVETFDLSLIWRVGVLVVGFLATWRAWRWLRRQLR